MRRLGLAVVAAALVWGCDAGYDPPELAEPMDTLAPAPKEPLVPGADEPGPQDEP
jgi:hypothetical protein